tara:strand:- start:59 stop:1126 length:1068 start_codon:yes stop_codon:yes gene_type:complete
MAKKQLKKSIIGGVGNYDPGFTINLDEEDNSEFKKKYEETRKDTKVGDAITDAFVSDNPYMALLDVATMGSIGGLGGKKFIKNFLTKSAKGKKLVEKLPFLAKLTEKVASPKNAGFEFAEAQELNRVLKNEIKASGLVAEGGVAGTKIKTGVNPKTGYKYDQEFMDLTTPVPSFSRQQLMGVEIPKMKSLGKQLDKAGFDASSLTKENIVFKGRSGGRTIIEVDLGNGKKQLFYNSTGSAQKAGSGAGGTTEGLWQPYAGHQKGGKSGGWFGKDAGYEDWYKSNSFRDISGRLEGLAAEKGINMNMQMRLSEDLSKAAKAKNYKDLTRADMDEAFKNYKRRVGADQTDNAMILKQ